MAFVDNEEKKKEITPEFESDLVVSRLNELKPRLQCIVLAELC